MSADPHAASRQIVTLSLFRFGRLADRAWAFAQMGLAKRPLRRLDGIGFVKLMGSGTGEGFTPVPDTGVVAILTTWPDLATARAQVGGAAVDGAAVFARYRGRAAETFTLHLAPLSARGRWSGGEPFAAPAQAPVPQGPVAALTRATIRLRALPRFWAREPAISRRIGADPRVLLKIGIGEVPWLHQVTFSVWPDQAAMDAFARADGPHAEAIRRVRAEGWFAEELYARFAVREAEGTWRGRAPLADAAPALAAE